MGMIAAAQIASRCYDAAATTQRVTEAIAEAARAGAWLVLFTESCIPGYPDWLWKVAPQGSSPAAEPFRTFEREYFANAITVPGPETERVAQACREHQIMAVVGVTERPERSGTLYSTLLYFGADGRILGRHRKSVPTFAERLAWGMGDGTTIRTIPTSEGIVGGLICWENLMPLARTTLYAQGVQIYVAPTQDNGERWLATARHIANEGRVWVVSTGVFQRESDFTPALRATRIYQPDELIAPGDSVIVDPFGNVVAGPARGVETILYAEAPASAALHARRGFDAVGHYGRADIFTLGLHSVNVLHSPPDLAGMPDHTWRVPNRSEESANEDRN